MHAPGYEEAWAASVRVAVANAVRGLWLHETATDPRVEALTVDIDTDGAIAVELRGKQGMPVGGYSL